MFEFPKSYLIKTHFNELHNNVYIFEFSDITLGSKDF